MHDAPLSKRRQYLALGLLSLGVLGLTGILAPSSGTYFRRFFGPADPLLVVVGSIVVGGAALHWLQAHGGFEILRGKATLRGIALSAGLATVLAGAIILADIVLRYPEDLNVPLPYALAFYPAVGYVAEIVFHVLPLTLLLLALAPLRKRLGTKRGVWLCIGLAALTEPIFQLGFEEAPLSWTGAYTGVHVFAIAVLQLYMFRRYDFVSMYVFRLIYYAYWHIAWGVLRLEVLF